MKKYQMIGSIALVVVMSGTVVFAAPVDKDVKAAERAEKKVERETVMAEKKVERVEKMEVKKAEIETKKVAKAYERVTKTISRLEGQSEKRKEIGMAKITKRFEQVQTKRIVQNKELDSQRLKRDGQRETFYANLEAKAQTDEQTTAIATFRTIVEKAVTDRRIAIDSATQALQADVDKLTAYKVAAIEDAYADYQASYKLELAKAGGACDEDATTDDLKNIAKDLNAELKAANATFRKDVQAMRQIGPEVQESVAVRKVAVKDAISVFKATVDAARADLIKAFGGELGVDDNTDTDDDEDEFEGEKINEDGEVDAKDELEDEKKEIEVEKVEEFEEEKE